jgi:hypothetical protein
VRGAAASEELRLRLSPKSSALSIIDLSSLVASRFSMIDHRVYGCGAGSGTGDIYGAIGRAGIDGSDKEVGES